MTTVHTICDLDDIPHNQTRGFSIIHNNETLDFFIVRIKDSIYAYINRCPHTGVNLEWMPDKFMDLGKTAIQCSTHGARFRIDNGYCIYGPCMGQSLEKLELQVRDNMINLII